MRYLGIKVAERIVAETGEMHDSIDMLEVLGSYVTDVYTPGRGGFACRGNGAVGEPSDVQPCYFMTMRLEQGNKDGSDITLVAGHKYAHGHDCVTCPKLTKIELAPIADGQFVPIMPRTTDRDAVPQILDFDESASNQIVPIRMCTERSLASLRSLSK
jgi:hypothetical protein